MDPESGDRRPLGGKGAPFTESPCSVSRGDGKRRSAEEAERELPDVERAKDRALFGGDLRGQHGKRGGFLDPGAAMRSVLELQRHGLFPAPAEERERARVIVVHDAKHVLGEFFEMRMVGAEHLRRLNGDGHPLAARRPHMGAAEGIRGHHDGDLRVATQPRGQRIALHVIHFFGEIHEPHRTLVNDDGLVRSRRIRYLRPRTHPRGKLGSQPLRAAGPDGRVGQRIRRARSRGHVPVLAIHALHRISDLLSVADRIGHGGLWP